MTNCKYCGIKFHPTSKHNRRCSYCSQSPAKQNLTDPENKKILEKLREYPSYLHVSRVLNAPVGKVRSILIIARNRDML